MNQDENLTSEQQDPAVVVARVPTVVRFGAAVVMLQCLIMLGYSLWLIVANLRGEGQSSLESDSAAANYVGVGTAVFLIIIFGFLAFHAWRTLSGHPSGRGAIVLIELILVGVAIYMFQGGAIALGIATLLSAVLALIGVFHPAAVHYAAARYELRRAGR